MSAPSAGQPPKADNQSQGVSKDSKAESKEAKDSKDSKTESKEAKDSKETKESKEIEVLERLLVCLGLGGHQQQLLLPCTHQQQPQQQQQVQQQQQPQQVQQQLQQVQPQQQQKAQQQQVQQKVQPQQQVQQQGAPQESKAAAAAMVSQERCKDCLAMGVAPALFASLRWHPRPYYKRLAVLLCLWGRDKKLPQQDLLQCTLPGLTKTLDNTIIDKLEALTDKVALLYAKIGAASKETIDKQLKQYLENAPPSKDAASSSIVRDFVELINKHIQVRGVLTLFGLRTTAGSIDAFPPSLEVLIESYNRPYEKNGVAQKISVGARALSKHYHRSSARFWGEMKGSDSAKNAQAMAILMRILEGTVWMNVHTLPHSEYVFEIREGKEGYGLRWRADGTIFRGFLEPQMDDGFSKGWKH